MSTHAGIQFAVDHKDIAAQWQHNSNSLVCLALQDEWELHKTVEWLDLQGVGSSSFYEPDYDNQLMAVAAMLEQKLAKQLKNRPLLLKGIN